MAAAPNYSTDTSILPESNDQYGTQQYWDERYAKETADTSFDWFLRPEQCLPLMTELIPDKSSRILMLGCGNSALSETMYDQGWTNITNIDYSGTLIAQMKEKHAASRPGMDWLEMDIRDLKFDAGSFDVALDKGTMDAMVTAKGDVWNPSEEVIANCNAEVDEVLRVLKPGPTSSFIYLTFAQPHFRRRYLTRAGWQLAVTDVGDGVGFGYYQFVLKRAPEAPVQV